MSNVIRANQAAYRQSFSADEQTVLLANPMGEAELTDEELKAIFGGCEGEEERCSEGEGEGGGGILGLPLLGNLL
jgi:mersacidin/lichenicidin family type 2 lantibiotic